MIRRLSHTYTHLRASPLGVGGTEPFYDALLDRSPKSKRPSRTLDVRNRAHKITPRQLADSLAEEFEQATESEMIVDSEIAAAKQQAKARGGARQSKKEKYDEGNESWGE